MNKTMQNFFLFLIILTISACNGEKTTEKRNSTGQADGAVKALSADHGEQKSMGLPVNELSSQDAQKLVLLHQPLRLHLFELPSEAITVWRSYRQTVPTLIILSQTPLLGTIPEALQPEANNLVMTADSKILRTKASNHIAQPVLLPQQSVAAAITAKFFSEVIWILPHQEQGEISLELFRKQMVESGTLWPGEAATLTSEEGIFRGTVRGLPFTACTLVQLPTVTGPCLVHFDLSYFSASYDNEIITPLFSLVHETLTKLREAKLTTLAATLSLSNKEGGVPLEIRFLKDVLKDTMDNPALLDQPLSEKLTMRKDARHMETFFQTDTIITLYRYMEKIAPDDASVQYDLYRSYWNAKDFELALQHLSNAAMIDSGYGAEYQRLAAKEFEKERSLEGLEYLQSAARYDVNNPFISLQLAEAYILSGKKKEALVLIKSLMQEKWSKIYYQEIPQILEEMKKKAES